MTTTDARRAPRTPSGSRTAIDLGNARWHLTPIELLIYKPGGRFSMPVGTVACPSEIQGLRL